MSRNSHVSENACSDENAWCLKCRAHTALFYVISCSWIRYWAFMKILPDTTMRSESPQVLQTQSDLLAYFIHAGWKTAGFYVLFSKLLLLFTFSNDLIHTCWQKSEYFVLIFVILRVTRNSRFFFFFWDSPDMPYFFCASLPDNLMNSVLERWCSFFQENTQKRTK